MRKNIFILISVILVSVLMLYTLKSQESKKDGHNKITHSNTTVKQTVKQETTHQSFKQNKPLKNSLEWTDFIGVEIPSDIDRVGSNIIELKRSWREATRQVFLQAFERNYMVIYYLLYRKRPYKGVYILQRNFRDFE